MVHGLRLAAAALLQPVRHAQAFTGSTWHFLLHPGTSLLVSVQDLPSLLLYITAISCKLSQCSVYLRFANFLDGVAHAMQSFIRMLSSNRCRCVLHVTFDI
jgi:hypothetical protein